MGQLGGDRCCWCLKVRVKEKVAGSRPKEEEGVVVPCYHGNIYPAHRTPSPSPTHVSRERTSEKCGWSENRRCLRVGQSEAGAWNVFTSLNDWYVPGGACVLGSGKEDVTWGLSVLSYSSHIRF